MVVGLTVQAGVMVGFSRLPETASLWLTAGLLAAHGLGAGLMLAALHRVALRNIPDTQMGSAAGLYSMLRFLGVVVGTALAGMLLQTRLDTGLDEAAAYRAVFLVFAFISVAGVAAGQIDDDLGAPGAPRPDVVDPLSAQLPGPLREGPGGPRQVAGQDGRRRRRRALPRLGCRHP